MLLTVLRARASCQSCRSKLPPRTEAWWDEERGLATCVSCRHFDEQAAGGGPAVPSALAPATEPPAPTTMPAAPSPALDGSALLATPPPAEPAPRGPRIEAPLPPRGPVVVPASVLGWGMNDPAPSSPDGPSGESALVTEPPARHSVRARLARAVAPAPDASPDALPADPPSPPAPSTVVDAVPTVAAAPRSVAALLRAAPRYGDRPPATSEAVETEPSARLVPAEAELDPIDEAPVWAEGDADGPMPSPVPVIEPWADREPIAAEAAPGSEPVPPDVAPSVEPARRRGSSPVAAVRQSRTKAKVIPRHVPALLEAEGEAVAVGASPLFWEPNPTERAAPALPPLRRFVPPTPVLPAHHHDLQGSIGETEPVAPAPTHSGLLLTATATDVDADGQVLDRGDMGEGRIGQTLEGARVHGIEVIHGHRFGPAATPVDHLVISANGVWVVHVVDVLMGPLERRDIGDWFRKDQRLYVDDAERNDLLDAARDRATTIAAVLAESSHPGLDVHPVLCFGTVQPAWVDEPFLLDGVAVTWRRHLVEPMLSPVLLDVETRAALTRWFADAAV